MSELSAKRIRELLGASDAAPSSKARGALLEKLASHALASIPGVSVLGRDVVNVHKSEEVDLVLMNRRDPEGLDLFDPFILVECKNTKQQVGATDLGSFARKLEKRSVGLGILFTRAGITGDADALRSAQQTLSEELTEGREILIITGNDLLALSTSAELVDLLLRRRSVLFLTRGFAEDRGWYVDPDEEPSAQPIAMLGGKRPAWRVIEDARRAESERVAQAILEQVPKLPDDNASFLLEKSNRLLELLEEATELDGKEHWDRVLGAMVALGAAAVAFLYLNGGWEKEPSDLTASATPYAPNVRHLSLASKLYQEMITTYALETLNGESLDRRIAALGLIGMMIESHSRLEDQMFDYLAAQQYE